MVIIMVSEINKLLHRIMKDNNPLVSFDDFALVSLLANRIMSKDEVEQKVDLKALCWLYDIDYNQL